MASATGVDGLRLLGGDASLDFANTVDPRHGAAPHEYLGTYDDLVSWGEQAGVLSADEAQRLRAVSAAQPADAQTIYARGIALRERIYRVFAAIARNKLPDTADLLALSRASTEALSHARIVATADGFAWRWEDEADALDRMLWPVVRGAADLLTSGNLQRIRECPGSDGCGWLFLDTSKNGSRRWCSMDSCGSRVKMRRHYARHHDKAQTAQAHPRR